MGYRPWGLEESGRVSAHPHCKYRCRPGGTFAKPLSAELRRQPDHGLGKLRATEGVRTQRASGLAPHEGGNMPVSPLLWQQDGDTHVPLAGGGGGLRCYRSDLKSA